ncbi:MAG: molybdopterin cofactor-binding domain-containing protein [Ginsengibacter sp.]
MKSETKIPRRKFLKISALSGVCLSLGYISIFGEDPKIVNLSAKGESPGIGLNPFIFIDTNGKVILYNHRPEMGQGTFEAIPQIIAEELEVDMNDINIMASPAERKIYGDQMVVGSRSINGNYDLMRKVGASAKEMLIAAAANKWNVSPEFCYAKNATVVNRKSNQKFSYGELVVDASKRPVPENPTLKEPKDFTIIGKSIPRQDIPLKVNGSAQFGIDTDVPGMLYASIERSPVLLGKLVSFNADKAKEVKGVKYVLETSRGVFGQKRAGIAVIAENYWAALQGRKQLDIKWDNADLENWSSEKIKEDYKNAAGNEAEVFLNKGDFDKALSNSAVKIQAAYETPYQAHAPMEPMNATVSVQKDQIDFWGSTQNPNGMKDFLSRKYNVAPEKVNIHYTFMGGAFGRRSLTDVVEEAADLSQKTGAPVKVIWTREDDVSQGPFRACSLNVFRGGLDKNGKAIALEHKVICQDIRNQYGSDPKPTGGIIGGINTNYQIPSTRISGILRNLYIPVSYWRSVYHSTNCFAHESFIDEMAHAAKKDPLTFRQELLSDNMRYSRALKTVREKSNWDKKETGVGKGVAIMERSGAVVAMVTEVRKIDGKIKPVRIVTAIDVGTPVNPDIVKAQTEGCIVMGLTAACKSGINIEQGEVTNTNFDKYHMLRINEVPKMEIYVISTTAHPEGAGEGALPAVAPSLTNAIFDLTGKRIRTLPFDLG